MTFPGTYNISYYKGDTLEFRVFPKDANGDPFILEEFVAGFTISTARGEAGIPNQVECFAEVSPDKTNILCAIRPSDGVRLTAGESYVYDIEISDSINEVNYPRVYTILTGAVSITDQITGALVVEEES
jgi:hypothetical protein